MRSAIRFPVPAPEVCAPVCAGDHWAVCPDCGDLCELDAAFWEAVALAGCQDALVRCASCGRLITVSIERAEYELEP